MKLVVVDDLDVCLKGRQAKEVYNVIKENASFAIGFDEKTGKLTITNPLEFSRKNVRPDNTLFEAIVSGDKTVNVQCDDKAGRSDECGNFYIIGRYGDNDGNTAEQYLYINDAKHFDKSGVRAAYKSILHEITKAFMGIGLGIHKYGEAHSETN